MFQMVSIKTSKYPQSVLEFDHMVKTWLSFELPSCWSRILCIFHYYPSSGKEETLLSRRNVSNILKESLECLSIY